MQQLTATVTAVETNEYAVRNLAKQYIEPVASSYSTKMNWTYKYLFETGILSSKDTLWGGTVSLPSGEISWKNWYNYVKEQIWPIVSNQFASLGWQDFNFGTAKYVTDKYQNCISYGKLLIGTDSYEIKIAFDYSEINGSRQWYFIVLEFSET